MDKTPQNEKSVDDILTMAYKEELTEVTVIGYDKDGYFWMASSDKLKPDTLWALERAKCMLMEHRPPEPEEEDQTDGTEEKRICGSR